MYGNKKGLTKRGDDRIFKLLRNVEKKNGGRFSKWIYKAGVLNLDMENRKTTANRGSLMNHKMTIYKYDQHGNGSWTMKRF